MSTTGTREVRGSPRSAVSRSRPLSPGRETSASTRSGGSATGRDQCGRPVRHGVDAVRASEEPHEVGAHVRVVVDHQDAARVGVVRRAGAMGGSPASGSGSHHSASVTDATRSGPESSAAVPGVRGGTWSRPSGTATVTRRSGGRRVAGHRIDGHRTAEQSHQLGDQRRPDAAVVGRRRSRAGGRDPQHRGTALPAQGDRDPPGGGDGDGPREQGDHHLLPHRPVDEGGLAEVRAVQLEGEPGVVGRGPEHPGQAGRERREVDRLEVRVDLPRVQPRELQQPVDHPPQALRVAVHELEIGAQARTGRRGVAQLGDRPEHQRERRAELVADPGEERRLGPVQLGQAFGAPLLGREGVRRRRRRGQVMADQLEERPVLLVQRQVRAHAGDQHGGGPGRRRCGRAGRRPRRTAARRAARRRAARDAAGPRREAAPRAGWRRGPRRPCCARSTPPRGATGAQNPSSPTVSRGQGPARLDALGGHQARAVVAEQVEQRGRDVRAVARQDLDGGRTGRLHVRRAAQLGELAQRPQPPLADDLRGGLGAGAEHPVGARLLAADRAQRVGEPRLLRPAAAGQQHRHVLLEDRLAGERVRQHGLQPRPHLGPGVRERRRQRVRVPRPEHRGVGVVVEQRPPRARRDVHRQLRAQQQLDGRAQRGRPTRRRPEGRTGPVDLAHAPRHLAVPDERRLHALTSRVRAGASMSGAA